MFYIFTNLLTLKSLASAFMNGPLSYVRIVSERTLTTLTTSTHFGCKLVYHKTNALYQRNLDRFRIANFTNM